MATKMTTSSHAVSSVVKPAFGLYNIEQVEKILTEHKRMMDRAQKNREVIKVANKRWIERKTPEELTIMRRMHHVTYMEKKNANKAKLAASC